METLMEAPARQARAAPRPPTLWCVLAMDWDGFYGTEIHVSAATREEAVRLATAEAEHHCRNCLSRLGFAYGMSSRDRDLDRAIARRAEVFAREARAKLSPVATAAVITRTPGNRR